MSLKWDGRECWALVLGASSGFGAATAKAWARAGFGIIGVHLDLRSSIAAANAVRDEIAGTGRAGHLPQRQRRGRREARRGGGRHH